MDAVHDLGKGIYFARQNYAGFMRRMVIIGVDLLVILLVGMIMLVIWGGVQGPVPILAWLGSAYFYLTLLRGSRLRTLGYILTGVRVVNLKGNRPSFFWMNLRLLLWALGPINPI